MHSLNIATTHNQHYVLRPLVIIILPFFSYQKIVFTKLGKFFVIT